MLSTKRPTNVSNVWILCLYPKKVDGTYPNYYKVLSQSLVTSLCEVSDLLDLGEVTIEVQNAGEGSVDFRIVRQKNGEVIGDIEYWSDDLDEYVSPAPTWSNGQ